MRVELSDVTEQTLEEIVGTECYELALDYVRRGAVVHRVWVAEQRALCG